METGHVKGRQLHILLAGYEQVVLSNQAVLKNKEATNSDF